MPKFLLVSAAGVSSNLTEGVREGVDAVYFPQVAAQLLAIPEGILLGAAVPGRHIQVRVASDAAEVDVTPVVVAGCLGDAPEDSAGLRSEATDPCFAAGAEVHSPLSEN